MHVVVTDNPMDLHSLKQRRLISCSFCRSQLGAVPCTVLIPGPTLMEQREKAL